MKRNKIIAENLGDIESSARCEAVSMLHVLMVLFPLSKRRTDKYCLSACLSLQNGAKLSKFMLNPVKQLSNARLKEQQRLKSKLPSITFISKYHLVF